MAYDAEELFQTHPRVREYTEPVDPDDPDGEQATVYDIKGYRYRRGPHGWYVHRLIKGDWQPVPFRIVAGGQKPVVPKDLWAARDANCLAVKQIVDDLGIGPFDDAQVKLQDVLADDDATADELGVARAALRALESLTYLIAWPDAFLVRSMEASFEHFAGGVS